jgi:ribosomal protein S27E
MRLTKVNKHTKAGVNGKLVTCPKCNVASRIYHFAWTGLICLNCKQEVKKQDWLVDKHSLTLLPPSEWADETE